MSAAVGGMRGAEARNICVFIEGGGRVPPGWWVFLD